ncbi:MAG: hypothetical protein Q9227_006727 [Pyrenula ochraceoflavens]
MAHSTESPKPIASYLSNPTESKKVFTTLLTNLEYLTGLLTLHYSLQKSGAQYPLVALVTSSVPSEGLEALRRRSIPTIEIPYLLPGTAKDFKNDPRFYDCWSKLTPFSLTQFQRVVQLDSDMLILKSIDELMDIPLDSPDLGGIGNRVFAASHACLCNPLKKPHYPKDWIPENCAFTAQHSAPEEAQIQGAQASSGLGIPNGGLQVVNPSQKTYDLISQVLKEDAEKTAQYEFADQSLLGDLFAGRWVPIPYVFNALKTLRWKGVHNAIWRDESVKNVHYILSPKPWDEKNQEWEREEGDETHRWWHKINHERLQNEKKRGIDDGF